MKLRGPKLFNLHEDPFERADDNSNIYRDWVVDHTWVLYKMQAVVAAQIPNFVNDPPRQKPASFSLDAVMRQLEEAGSGSQHWAWGRRSRR